VPTTTNIRVHKATPVLPSSLTDREAAVCSLCGQDIHRVPGGDGPTWVHTATGAVAGPGSPELPLYGTHAAFTSPRGRVDIEVPSNTTEGRAITVRLADTLDQSVEVEVKDRATAFKLTGIFLGQDWTEVA
jgi:hypothetical protein